MTNGDDNAFPAFQEGGLTKREYFVAMADCKEWSDTSISFMEKVVGENVPNWQEEPLKHVEFYAKFHAIIKCIKADELIEQLKKTSL